MITALVMRWGARIPGREAKAEEVFGTAVSYFGELVGEKKILSFEPFIFKTGETTGFFVFKGTQEQIDALPTYEKFRDLFSKAAYVVEGLRIDYAYSAEEIPEMMTRAAKVRAELGLML